MRKKISDERYIELMKIKELESKKKFKRTYGIFKKDIDGKIYGKCEYSFHLAWTKTAFRPYSKYEILFYIEEGNLKKNQFIIRLNRKNIPIIIGNKVSKYNYGFIWKGKERK